MLMQETYISLIKLPGVCRLIKSCYVSNVKERNKTRSYGATADAIASNLTTIQALCLTIELYVLKTHSHDATGTATKMFIV